MPVLRKRIHIISEGGESDDDSRILAGIVSVVVANRHGVLTLKKLEKGGIGYVVLHTCSDCNRSCVCGWRSSCACVTWVMTKENDRRWDWWVCSDCYRCCGRCRRFPEHGTSLVLFGLNKKGGIDMVHIHMPLIPPLCLWEKKEERSREMEERRP